MKRALAVFIVLTMCLAGLPLVPSTQALRIPKMTSMNNADAFFYGDGVDEWAGWSVSEAGDFNGDGFDDFLVGAPDWFFGLGPGTAYLVYGKATGWAINTSLGVAENSFVGTHNGDWAGYSVAGVGDVNGDGYDDILIGAPYDDANLMNNSGQAYLFLGRADGYGKNISVDSAQASYIGEHSHDGAGWSVAGVGDVNSDGYDDFIIGAPFNKDGGSSGSDPYLSAGKTYLIFGKPSGWALGQNLSNADASFIGVDSSEQSGFAIGGGGDLNRDGINDFLIGAHYGFGGWGRVYVIFGRTSGWTKNVDLGPVSSVIGEHVSSDFGCRVDIPGDVNGDNIDDLLIGAEHVGMPYTGSGAAYLIFGRAEGWWGSNVSVTGLASASFLGEAMNDYLGSAAHGAGDVNGDGLADILIGAHNHVVDHPYIGRAYLILGKTLGWAMNVNVSKADVVYLPMFPWSDNFGQALGSAGDVNGDGTDDVVIGARGQYSYVYDECGYAFLSFPSLNEGPSVVSSIKAFKDSAYINEVTVGHQEEQIYVELRGTDANASNPDTALVNVSSEVASPKGFILRLYETGNHTGIFRGSFKISNLTDQQKAWIKVFDGDIVVIRTLTTPITMTKFKIEGGMKIVPSRNETATLEDEFYMVQNTLGTVEPTTWHLTSNASWLTWTEANKTLTGTPRNYNVGWFNVNIKVWFPNNGTTLIHDFILTVINTPPKITTKDVLFTDEEKLYKVDYNSTDDGQGIITWNLQVGPPWLSLNASTGVLQGTPTSADVKNWTVHLNVNDGNGGVTWSNFTLQVNKTRHPPKIIGTDLTVAYVGTNYWNDYNVTDPDVGDSFSWSLETNAFFLLQDPTTGVLKGYPTDADLGVHYVKVMVKDQEGLSDTRNFNLNVIPFNNRPWFAQFPSDTSLYDNETFRFLVQVNDKDPTDIITFKIATTPGSTLSIAANGSIEWKATRKGFTSKPYVMRVDVSVTDGKETIWRIFNITLKKHPPVSTLMFPTNNTRIGTTVTLLKWTGKDEWNEPLSYDVYLGDQPSDVQSHQAKALKASGAKGTDFNATGLVMGTTYYWTVVPQGGLCQNGYFKFVASTNGPPVLEALIDRSAEVGQKFSIVAKGSDPDPNDSANLTFSLGPGAPEGLSIDPKSGKISWTPRSDQVGKHKVTVRLSDGKEFVEGSFYITVKQKTHVSMAAEWPLLLIIVIIIACVSAVVIWRLKKKDSR
jgi:hypothetical protein